MPTYEYGCEACAKTWELEQRITEEAIKKCPECGELKARRLISGGTFMLKGSGWYADGYGSKPAKAEGKSESKSDTTKPDSTKSDSAKSDSAKSDGKSESKAAATPSSGASDS